MSSDDDDESAWQRLTGIYDDDNSKNEEIDNIGRIQVGGQHYEHASNHGKVIRIADDPSKGLSFQIWPSALTLVKYAESREPGFWKGKKAIELGTGCGLVGMVLAALGAHVALTDLPQTMEMLAENIALNAELIREGEGSVAAFPLVWGETKLESLPQVWQNVDCVLAADVVYHRELFEPLLSTLNDFGATNKSCEILISHVRRWRSDKLFFKKARKTFMINDISHWELSSKDTSLPSKSKGDRQLYKLTRKGS